MITRDFAVSHLIQLVARDKLVAQAATERVSDYCWDAMGRGLSNQLFLRTRIFFLSHPKKVSPSFSRELNRETDAARVRQKLCFVNSFCARVIMDTDLRCLFTTA